MTPDSTTIEGSTEVITMNGAHIHLLLNHLPVLLIPFGAIVLAHAVKFGNEASRKFAVVLLVAAGALAIPAYLTGEPAEDIAENIPGVTKDAIHEHEEAGEFALIAGIVTAVVASTTLVLQDKKRKIATIFTFVVAVWAFSVMARTAYLGGEIRHSEFSNPPAAGEHQDHAGGESK